MFNLSNFNGLKNFRKFDHYYLYILLFGIASSILLISNPGYYSHDELQKLDDILKYGYSSYFERYTELKAGPHFGYPVRPLSFFIQGIYSYFLEDYPLVVHLCDVFSHIFNACVFYFLASRFKIQKKTAFIASLIFLISPLTTLATGWSAALMDRWYIFFGMLSLLGAYYFIDKKFWWGIVLVGFGSTCAILSKETALVVPSFLIIFLLRDGIDTFRSYRVWAVGFVCMLPIVLYLTIRYPAIVASLANENLNTYQPSLNNVYTNTLAYLAFPLVYGLKGLGGWVNYSYLILYLSAICNLSIGLLVGRLYGYRYFFLYVAGYTILVVPVLFINSVSDHYLYGSALAMSLSIACLLQNQNRSKFGLAVKSIGVFYLTLLTLHTFNIQRNVYNIGLCQSRINNSLVALYASSKKPSEVYFSVLPEARKNESTLIRYLFGRDRIGVWDGIKFVVLPSDNNPPEENEYYTMTQTCHLESS